jgi:hypothetical protein
MGETHYPPNDALMRAIGFKYTRTDKVSICFGLKELQKVKLKFNGNKIVDSFEEFPNSVIVGKEDAMSEDDRAAIDDYVRYNDEVELEHVENLMEMNVL